MINLWLGKYLQSITHSIYPETDGLAGIHDILPHCWPVGICYVILMALEMVG